MQLSILTTVHDVPEADLRLNLTSSLAQDADLEVIVVADAATESNLSILKEFASADTRLKVFGVEDGKNVGPGAALNRALMYASGEYIGVVDGDDWADTNFFGTLLKRADAKLVPVVKGNVLMHRNGVPVRKLDICDAVCANHYKFSWQHWSAIYNRKFLLENGIFWFPDTSKNAETLFLAKVCAFTDSLSFRPDVFYNYNRRPNSVDADLLGEQKFIDSAHVRYKAAEFLLMVFNNLVPGHATWYIGEECLSRLIVESARASSNKAYEAAARGFVSIVNLVDDSSAVIPFERYVRERFPKFEGELCDYEAVLAYMKSQPYQTAVECS